MFKQFSRKCGCIDWEKCTGQRMRALCITLSIQAGLPAGDTARLAGHRSIKSQGSYEQETNQRIINRHLALQAPPIPEQNENVDPKQSLVPISKEPKVYAQEAEKPLPSPVLMPAANSAVPVEDILTDQKRELEYLRLIVAKKSRTGEISPIAIRTLSSFQPKNPELMPPHYPANYPPPVQHGHGPHSDFYYQSPPIGHFHLPSQVPIVHPPHVHHPPQGYQYALVLTHPHEHQPHPTAYQGGNMYGSNRGYYPSHNPSAVNQYPGPIPPHQQPPPHHPPPQYHYQPHYPPGPPPSSHYYPY
jgi:hypothetical protein